MASGSTPVKARPYPLESDVPDVAADMHSLALSLENVPNFYQGSLAGRASVTPTIGDRYVVEGDSTSSNNNIEWYWTGSAWVVPLLPPWTAIPRATGVNIGSGGYTPGVRGIGDRIELCGGFLNASGGSITTWGTLPVGFRPAETVNFIASSSVGSGTVGISIGTGGQVNTTVALANGALVFIDSCWFRLQ